MSLFEFSSTDKLLLLGEGNFSFSCCLFKQMEKKFGFSDFSNVYATCYQDELSMSASRNVSFLKSKGAEIFLGVDATKLELTHEISSLKFNKIIFNFPHVGGKMKIHLNRELLRNFFISSSNMLQPGGQVVVTLCSGQGGTGFEIVSRRWDDTWQITEQAAHGSFVLSEIEHFPELEFEGYQPVGYRGREQMFCTKSAIIHGFCKVTPPSNYLCDTVVNDVLNFHSVENVSGLQVCLCHKVALSNNPFTSKCSPQNYVIEILTQSFQKYSNGFSSVNRELDYHTEFDSNQALCVYNGKKCSLRSSLLQVIQHEVGQNYFAQGLVFQKCSSEFSNVCVSCHCVFRSSQQLNIIRDFIGNCFNIFNSSVSTFEKIEGDSWKIFFDSEGFHGKSVAWGDLKSGFVTINLDLICSSIFSITIRELWTENIKFDHFKNKLVLPSLYPLLFKFDICFGTNKELEFEQFYYILHQVPDKFVESVNLLSIYRPVDSDEKFYCFRLVYRSYKMPLHRKLVIEIHQNVIGKLLEKVLNVRIH